MRNPVVYLCGPINQCTNEEAWDWRQQVAYRFDNTLDPMRRDYRGKEHNNYREIVDLDKIDVKNSDIILAYCPKPSVGTSMEIFMAWQLNKIVVVVAPEPVNPWLRYHSTKVCETLDDAIEWIEGIQ